MTHQSTPVDSFVKLQISSDQSISITNVEVINLDLRLVLFSDALPTVIAEDFVDAVRAQIESLFAGEVVKIQPMVFVVRRAVVRVDGEHSMVELRSGAAENIADEYLSSALSIHG